MSNMVGKPRKFCVNQAIKQKFPNFDKIHFFSLVNHLNVLNDELT